MKKQKAKFSASQKRRSKAKQKKKSNENDESKSGVDWVEHHLDWISFDDFHRRLCGAADEEHNDVDNSSDDDGSVTEHDVASSQCEVRSLDSDAITADDNDEGIKIISWNVLADAYCNRSSHQNLPAKYQRVVFDRQKRPLLVRQTLTRLVKKLRPDFLALQEVDPPLGIANHLHEECGYKAVETESSKDGKTGRVDSCGLYYQSEKWVCLDHETVFLDDIAVLSSGRISEQDMKRLFRRSPSRDDEAHNLANNRSLQGLQCSFVRKNVALLVRLEHQATKQRVVVAVAHLFWNPSYEYVKLCQIHYVAQRTKEFCGNNEPVILCGDFNSKPNTSVHQYLTKGTVNAKLVAPWYALSRRWHQESSNGDEKSQSSDQVADSHLAADVETSMQKLQVSSDDDHTISEKLTVKYMLDFTLNRLCRWMRILGLDAALETEEEERQRTKHSNVVIFQRCQDEGRALLTTSSRLVHRKDCPPGTYLLDTKDLVNLERTLVHLLVSHGVQLEPSQMLTRCVVCNGSIEEVFDEQRKSDIFVAHQAPQEIRDGVSGVYQCDSCAQGYWWHDKPTSSASRVKNQATRLLETCIRGGVHIGEDLGIFDFVDVHQLKAETAWENDVLVKEQLDIVNWLQDETLTNLLKPMASAYATSSTHDGATEALPFTNVTAGFVGLLDYVMYDWDIFRVLNLLYVPTTCEELNELKIPNGHLLPSCRWPSDHLAVGCQLVLRLGGTDSSTKEAQVLPSQSADFWCSELPSPSVTTGHGQRCGCGCVPAIPSMFEMAELRKQARRNKMVK